MAMNDALHRRQADAGARKLGRTMQPLKSPEKRVGIGHIETGSVVANVKRGLAFVFYPSDLDPRIRALAAKVRYVIDPANPYPAAYTGHVRAVLTDGRVVEERQDHLRGGAQQPLTRAAIEAKFFANAAHGGWAKAEATRDLVRGIFAGPIDLAVLRG